MDKRSNIKQVELVIKEGESSKKGVGEPGSVEETRKAAKEDGFCGKGTIGRGLEDRAFIFKRMLQGNVM